MKVQQLDNKIFIKFLKKCRVILAPMSTIFSEVPPSLQIGMSLPRWTFLEGWFIPEFSDLFHERRVKREACAS